MRRFLWSLLASAILNIFAWVALPARYSAWFTTPAPAAREKVAVAYSPVHLKRRIIPSPKPRRVAFAPAPPPQTTDAGSMGPPQPATLALPHSWAKQDFGYLDTLDTTEWLDWKHQSAKWVPRVFLWKWKVKIGYMSRPSLQGTIKQIIDSLHDEGAKLYASNAEQVCGGQRSGWYLSYTKTSDTPPIRFDETLYMTGETVYRAMYLRAADQPEDVATRKALDTLCWP
jgi:hypothetical protein